MFQACPSLMNTLLMLFSRLYFMRQWAPPCDVTFTAAWSTSQFFSMGFQDGVKRRRWGARMDSGSSAAFISFIHRFWNKRATSADWLYNQQVTGYMSENYMFIWPRNYPYLPGRSLRANLLTSRLVKFDGKLTLAASCLLKLNLH